MRLIHYSPEPLLSVYSRPHCDERGGFYKTAGLWVSVEGEDDWLAWCKAEGWGLGGFACATEVLLADDANVKHLSGSDALDEFSKQFCIPGDFSWRPRLDWEAIRQRWHGLIIAPYCWDRRLENHTGWYYGWDCASGVIWDAAAVKELRAIEPPDLSQAEEAA